MPKFGEKKNKKQGNLLESESENNYRIPTPWPGVSQDVSKQNVIFQKINSQMVNATLHPLGRFNSFKTWI